MTIKRFDSIQALTMPIIAVMTIMEPASMSVYVDAWYNIDVKKLTYSCL
jgi:hypothetical protein